MKVSDGMLTIIADISEMQALKAELCQFKEVAMGMKALVA